MSEAWQPDAPQLAGADWLISRNRAGLFLPPGVGKTSTTLAVLSELRRRGGKPALIVADSRICYSVWPNEIRKWSDFEHLTYTFLHPQWVGGATKASWQMHNVFKEKLPDIVAINHEGLPWLVDRIGELRAFPFGPLVLDESSEYGSRASTRTKVITALAGSFSQIYELTGSPAENSLETLFSQAMILDGGLRLGKYITHFRRAFGTLTRRTSRANPRGWHEWTPAPDALQQIARRLSDVFLHVEGVHKMPDITYNVVETQLPPEAVLIYNKMEKDYFAFLGKHKLQAKQAAAAQMKLRQIVSGYVYDSTDTPRCVHDGKLKELEKLLLVHKGEPVLIGVAFLHEARAIQKLIKKLFKVDAPYLGAGISPRASDEAQQLWNAGKLPALPVHPASAAHGLNLQAGGATVIWYSLTWDAEEHKQLNGRVYRRGQQKDVVIHYLISQGTVDERVLSDVNLKSANQAAFFKELLKWQSQKWRARP